MTAVDTNIIVQFLTQDQPEQGSRAVALLRSGVAWICKTALLETEWVLRSLYGFAPQQTADAESFVTFDKKFVKRAWRMGIRSVEAL